MNKTVRNALIAAGVAVVVSFVFSVLDAMTHSADVGSAGLTLAGVSGALIFVVLQFRGGNRRVSPADAQARAQALTFSCPPDRALVYFIRTGFAGKAVGVDIAVDGKTAAQIRSPRFTYLSLAPGSHALTAQIGDGQSKLSPQSAQFPATLAAGSVTLLHIGIQRGLLTSQLVFEPWTLDKAKAQLGKIGMVLPETLAATTR
jgi:hypothetical protein